jgi:hypothetical protein
VLAGDAPEYRPRHQPGAARVVVVKQPAHWVAAAVYWSQEMKTFTVTPGSELDKVLDEAAAGPIRVERGGMLYRLTVERDSDPWNEYKPDPNAVLAALDETVGSWSDIDTDVLITDIYRWREEGSRPADRP